MFYIEVPDLNDSVSRITLGETDYNIRFTYSPKDDSWSFSLYDLNLKLIIGMVKIVPLHPLLWQYVSVDLPEGIFGCWTELDHVGRNDFKDKRALFGYIPYMEIIEGLAEGA